MRWPWKRAAEPKLDTGPRMRWRCDKCGYESWVGGYHRFSPPPDPLPKIQFCGPQQRKGPCLEGLLPPEGEHLHAICPKCAHVTFRKCKDADPLHVTFKADASGLERGLADAQRAIERLS
jgi:predicted RNA-binding Zn-ribbon protein involved in translation (DUF1610 family)